ncbi:hypothetical protein BC827DRAFT_1271215 [Russula dissimulans]|nr:hypothetical protein BC827DRAFT_1271215 [Russula dissimulans]
MSRFESGKRTYSTSSASSRRESSPVPSVTSPAPGSTYSADRPRRPASYGQFPASNYGSKQPSQIAGRTQHVDAMSKFYANPSRESLSIPTSAPSLTRSNESGDSSRPSADYSLPKPERGVPPAAETSNSSTYETERGRPTDRHTDDAAALRESSRAPTEGSETEYTDDEASDQGDVPDDPPLATRGSSNPATTEGVEPITQAIGPSQHTEVTSPAVGPALRETSPSLSLDSSAIVSLSSKDSTRSSEDDSHATDAHGLADQGVPLAETTTTIQQPTELPERDQLLNVAGKPNPSTSAEIPPAWVDAPEDAAVNANQSSAAHVLLQEPLSLTDLGTDGPAATEAVKYLVQAVGRDVVTFRRNTQVSFMVVERAREIVKTINEYIVKVENSTTGDWDSFEKFTMAIEPLEGILFTLLAFTEDEKARYLANTSSIEECVSSAENWASNREGLSKALDGFDTREELVGLFDEPNTDSRKREHKEAQIYDDLTLLGEMRTTLQTFISEDPDMHVLRFPPHVREVETSLDKLQNRLINESHPDWLTVITIQTSMLVEGVVEIVKVASLDADILDHLKSKAVWKAALELVEVLEGIDESQPGLPQSAQMKYNAFVETLKKPGKFPLPGSYVGLMKQAGHIRRPFQAQSFALVMLCRYLADRFNAIGDSAVTIDNFNILEEAFDKTLDALQAATRAVIELKTFDLTNFRSNDTVETFGEAEALIRESFKSFNRPSSQLDAEWTQKQSELTAAFKKDKERMAKLNNMLSRPQSPSNATEKVKVNVTIHESSPDGTVLGATSVEEVITMRLLALRWSIAGVLKPEEAKRRARTAGSFFKQTDGTWLEILASHSTLEEIVGSESEVDLKLVVP